MSNKKKQIPAIRFNGFSEAWEQRKFKNFIFKAGKKNTKGEDFPAYSVSNKLGLVNQSEQFDGSRLDGLDKIAYKLVNPGEFAYNPARINVGSIALNNLEETVIVSSLYVVLKMDDRLYNEFILQFIKSNNFINEVIKNTEGSVREYLFFENFKNIRFPYVSDIEEQIKIGALLKQLDNTINLYQRQLDNYKELKKAVLQKMFPRGGEKVPEIRFDDFTGEWEQRKLKEVVVERNQQVPESIDYPLMSFTATDGVTPKSDRYNREFLVKSDNKKYKKTELGDLIYSSNNLDVGSIGINKTGNAVISPVYSIFYTRDGVTPEFVDMLIQKKDFINKMIQFRQGVVYGQWRIHESDFLEIETRIPSSKEQIKLGSLFKQIDNTITFHQQKVNDYKKLKEGVLTKMFI